ncbi:MAG: hypothetical protein ACI4MF_02020 [Candidatus Faecivicinus sp.]
MRIGCGRSEMVFPEGFFPTEGFTRQVHPLYVRALYVGQREPVVLVSIEMTSLPDDESDRLREEAASAAQAAPKDVWVAVTHTFSAPHILPAPALKSDEDRRHRAQLQEILAQAVCGAVRGACRDAEESTLTLMQGESETLASRDIELPEGWWIGCGGTGPSDRTLSVLKVQAGERLKGMLIHLNVQSSVLDGTGDANGKCVSGDLAGVACAALERRFPGAKVLFLVGAAGDQAPVRRARGYAPDGRGGYAKIDLHEAGVAIAEELGAQLAGEVERTLNGAGDAIEGEAIVKSRTFDLPAKKMNRNLHELRPSRTAVWEPDGLKEQTIELLSIGSLGILGVKPELTDPTARRIRESSPFAHTLVATMVNGGAKYMADRSAYDRCMYEAVNSPFAPGAAEILEGEVKKLFER